ncbi:P1 family peptidase [Nonomuraea gerenzanensis]|uniref:Endo-type 6-aminohexanoate oligomer hydrolase n=1 Tax=Nonomuraea gerenzanensis TaxID=93944 RepID=A0A1M4E4Q5_9ACTN|nr:P1 family peptidase [Nonomuraea gerenzanensis]UBU16043.1 P1 family peptidase [Nonomuraea gerenzanensis]SBO93845.1 endo-type 6-aminohexanoate oligomer hydrolase [Nonomuraea gerenzanensis]
MTTEHRLATPSAFAPGVPRNADLPLTPQPSPGRGSVAFDLPGVRVGTAEYGEGPTGCTVIHLPKGARTAVDARGGAVGMSGGYDYNHAICLAGGSVYGLAAAAGVSDELLSQRNNLTKWDELQLVSGAVIYDFSCRDTAVYPDAELGRAAVRWAKEGEFPVGRCGAGRTASAGKVDFGRAEFAGQGAAFGTFGEIKVLVATVVNSVGAVIDRQGRVVRGNYHAELGERRHPSADYAELTEAPAVMGNTTLTVMVTNVRLTDVELLQVGRQVHSSMHRGIQPFHTLTDGDTMFAMTTDEVEPAGVKPTGLGTLASEVAWDAILSAAE